MTAEVNSALPPNATDPDSEILAPSPRGTIAVVRLVDTDIPSLAGQTEAGLKACCSLRINERESTTAPPFARSVVAAGDRPTATQIATVPDNQFPFP